MKLLALLSLSLLSSAIAFCPNLCNGHGKCENQDRCSCYKYAGTTRGDFPNQYDVGDQRSSWTGADCSMRTCPLAFAFSGALPNGLSVRAAISSAVGVNSNYVTVALSTSDPYFTGTLTDVGSVYGNFATGQKIRLYTAAGASNSLFTIRSVSWASNVANITVVETITSAYTTSDYISYEPLEGEYSTVSYHAGQNDYGQWDANGAHGLLECAGQGICDRTTGQCNCFPGYEGEACTRTACPNSCSGHGVCIEASRLASDYGGLYSKGWDANKHFGCKCDVGFRGPDCSLQECPSDYDPLNGCGGGRCNTGGFYLDKTGTAKACPNAVTYSTTVKNVVYNIETSDCSSGEQRDCSGRGICDYDTGMCQCFSGFFGESCNIQTVLV